MLINLIQKDPRDERTGAQAQSTAAAAASAATPTDGAAPPSKDGQNYSIGCDVFKVSSTPREPANIRSHAHFDEIPLCVAPPNILPPFMCREGGEGGMREGRGRRGCTGEGMREGTGEGDEGRYRGRG